MISKIFFRFGTISATALPSLVTAGPVADTCSLTNRDEYPSVTPDNRPYHDLDRLGAETASGGSAIPFDPSGVLWLDGWKNEVFGQGEDDDECRLIVMYGDMKNRHIDMVNNLGAHAKWEALPDDQKEQEPDRWASWARSTNGVGPWCNRSYPSPVQYMPLQARLNKDRGAVYVIMDQFTTDENEPEHHESSGPPLKYVKAGRVRVWCQTKGMKRCRELETNVLGTANDPDSGFWYNGVRALDPNTYGPQDDQWNMRAWDWKAGSRVILNKAGQPRER